MAGLSGRQLRAMLRKDIVMELRTKEMIMSMGLYALLTMVVYFVALSQAGSSFDPRDIAAGLLWLAFIFTSMLGLNRSLVHEKDQGCLEALLLSPVDRPVIFFAKAGGNLIFLLAVELLTLPVFGFLFLQGEQMDASSLALLPLILLAGSVGISGVGTLLATMSVNTSGKDFVLAMLFIPLMYPLLLGAVIATGGAIVGGAEGVGVFWTGMGWVVGYDVIMLLASYGLYEFIVGA
ncbi:MAG TPA: heme ABC transporter permease CcmB [Coriobacteriia bacterium]|uniref:heme exporter protein CcmB n=1 Tax=Anaerosoma tenue TaxID=2933588 RepID=UPI00076CFFA9|nr:heme exporter protein CcmB [Anaerosoma tenue]KUK49187.1 MAG: ABC-type transport system involved in cytochrome c biogenesis, permease component [Actinobacteria bacterium 66_15]MCK8114708.1 heme exporter protein CcmB [Anaerosoma tenue]HAL31111.1 heme ABC transporter permease CcmB [Coriobacteriia bacterium]HHJ99279.1 heme ABC transporter permease CcmB [Actinomycetota bacterium]